MYSISWPAASYDRRRTTTSLTTSSLDLWRSAQESVDVHPSQSNQLGE
ncbi:MAG: hypothetical protein AAGI08_01115 [Bacteroidota bacterium]